MLNIDLEPELENRLHVIADKLGHSTADLAREAILELIEDHEDLAEAEAVLKSPGRRWTLAEIDANRDLKADEVAG